MSLLTNPPASGPLDLPDAMLWRLPVEKYHEMIRTGVLNEDDPLELLDGCLVTKMVKRPPHRASTQRVRRALDRVVPKGWYVDSQGPITLPFSEPEPDGLVVRGASDDYADRHPGPHEVGLVVEVADESLRRDEILKKRIYAEAGIPVYWIVNLMERRLEVYADPTGPVSSPDYRIRTDYSASATVPLVLDGVVVAQLAVKDLLLPPAQA